MQTFTIEQPAKIFANNNHERRIIFVNGEIDPRQEEKIGINIHEHLAGIAMHRTIKVNIKLIEKNGNSKTQTIYFDRNSTVKYLAAVYPKEAITEQYPDNVLIQKLNNYLAANKAHESQDAVTNTNKQPRQSTSTQGIFNNLWTNSNNDYITPNRMMNKFRLGPWATEKDLKNLFEYLEVDYQMKRNHRRCAVNDLFYLYEWNKRVHEYTGDKTEYFSVTNNFVRGVLGDYLENKNPDIAKCVADFLSDKPRMVPYKQDLITLINRVIKQTQRIVIVAYPTYLKDVAYYASKQKISLKKYHITGMTCGHDVSQELADKLIRMGYGSISKAYNTKELHDPFALETETERKFRDLIQSNTNMAKDLHQSQPAPMVYQYNPDINHLEHFDEGQLFVTEANDKTHPAVKYPIHDDAQELTVNHANALLMKHSLENAISIQKPLLLIHEKNMAVKFGDSTLSLMELESTIAKIDRGNTLRKYGFYTNKEGQLDILIELKDGVPAKQKQEKCEKILADILLELCHGNDKFKEAMLKSANLPALRLFTSNHSPIIGTVLIFEDCNLPAKYTFPQDEKDMVRFSVTKEKMSGLLASPVTANTHEEKINTASGNVVTTAAPAVILKR